MRKSVWIVVATTCSVGVAAGCSDTLVPAEADRLEVARGDDQEAVTPAGGGHLIIGWGSMPDSLRVRLTDPSGAPLAGRTVSWIATAGSVSPETSTTNDEGTASTRWSLHSSTGWAPVGTYEVLAIVPGVTAATFTGHARAGVTLESISFTPDTVKVAPGDAPVSVAIRLTDDRRDAALEQVHVQLYNPSATSSDFQSVVADLTRTEGTPPLGEWTGSFIMPADAEPGAWSLGRVSFSWGRGGEHRATLLDGELAQLGMTYQLHVVAGPAPMSISAEPGGPGSP